LIELVCIYEATKLVCVRPLQTCTMRCEITTLLMIIQLYDANVIWYHFYFQGKKSRYVIDTKRVASKSLYNIKSQVFKLVKANKSIKL